MQYIIYQQFIPPLIFGFFLYVNVKNINTTVKIKKATVIVEIIKSSIFFLSNL